MEGKLMKQQNMESMPLNPKLPQQFDQPTSPIIKDIGREANERTQLKEGRGNENLGGQESPIITPRFSNRLSSLSNQIFRSIPGQRTSKVPPGNEVDDFLIYISGLEDFLEKSENGKSRLRYLKGNHNKGGSETIGVKALINQIKRLYIGIAQLVPAEEALLKIERLRERRIDQEAGEKKGKGTWRDFLKKRSGAKPNSSYMNENNLLEQLKQLEAKVRPDMSITEAYEIWRSLEILQNDLNVSITRFNIELMGLVNSAKASPELVACDIEQIGYKDLNAKALSHCEVIKNLLSQLDPSELTKGEINKLSDKSYSMISSLTEIEERRNQILRLNKANTDITNKLVYTVITYIVLAILLIVGLIIAIGPTSYGTNSLDMKIPLIGVPWPVILWSLIGSFAAMIHRFNKNPIYDFSDAVKWMLTRPVQGIVLGCAVYLILVSGSFLINGALPANAIANTSKELILILSFFVGFSDRFADSVFTLLLRNYTPESKNKEETTTS
jgi:hypothetical protein